MPTTPDPRPLTGEPVALDLLNTRWMHEGAVRDLLTDTEGLAVWLAANGLDFPADDTVLRHVLQARDALRAAVDGPPGEAGERAPLADAVAARVDAVLAHGRVRLTLTAHGPGETPEFSDPSWGPAWLAVRSYLELLDTAPDRIRRCAHDACILHFFDTSRNGTRRWCSMAACGNRAKASRHYARTKES
ncbi:MULTISPECIES: CGNR zinc finger domain-containing protein [unclassified Streptomyces]|uniref:CGNR zinc finger domain-containing protein n=1 Tax=unclassified Streptomyces TaxID=2593676 RepID=UPI002E814229|nr:CGNR zinc finger domain-containing protein [Streptomyces sp. NBC_00589]WTI39190.1 CGNR zinc finger domain-containing protein [Streptomyces sp. NBC_00775]WUB27131.1 CGNR zinc finger domain-containing protein [Streptomyces sp. NBC_00589]